MAKKTHLKVRMVPENVDKFIITEKTYKRRKS